MKNLFLILLLFPTLLFSLSESDCKKKYEKAVDEWKSTQNLITQINATIDVDKKIPLLEKAITHNDCAVKELNEITASFAFKKIKGWREEMLEKCVKSKETISKSQTDLKKTLDECKAISHFVNAQNTANQWVELINQKSRNFQATNEDSQKNHIIEIISLVENAILSYEKFLLEYGHKTNINFFIEAAKQNKSEYENFLEGQKKLLVKIQEFELVNDVFKKAQAKQRPLNDPLLYPAHLKEIPESRSLIEALLKDYVEVLYSYKQVKEGLQEPEFILQLEQKIQNLDEEIVYLKNFLSSLQEGSEEKELNNQLKILENQTQTLKAKKIIEAILQELSYNNEEHAPQLNSLKEQIRYLEELKIDSSLVLAAKMSDEEFYDKELQLKEAFYTSLSRKLEHSPQIHYLNHSTKLVSLDGLSSDDTVYTLHLEQFYRFLVQSPEVFKFLKVDVIQDSNVIYTESISLPEFSSFEWNAHVIEEGFSHLVETRLKTEYGLDLSLSCTIHENEKAFIIKLKNNVSNYQYAFSLEGSPLYTCQFIPSLPWQIKNVSNSTVSIPLNQFLQTFDPNVLEKTTESIELLSHDILDNFVEAMKRDPLALAQYVQNEIQLIEPQLEKENEMFKAPLIRRGALEVFLEKQGTPWEQCALLVYFLRKAGYETYYGCETPLSLPSNYVEKLLFTELSNENEVLLNYPWVLFKHENEWISLFPWMKDMQVHEGYDLYDFLPEEYSTAERWVKNYLKNDPNILKHISKEDKDDTAGVLFVKFVEEHLRNQGLSLDDVGIQRKIIKKQFSIWNEFPRPFIKEGSDFNFKFSLEKECFFHATIKITAKESGKTVLDLHSHTIIELTRNPYTIFFTTNANNECLFHFKKINLGYTSFPLASSDHHFDVIVSINPETSQTFTVSKGTCATLCFNSGGSHSQMTSFYGSQYAKKQEESSKMHSLLSFLGAVYFDKCVRAEAILAQLHKLPPPTLFNFGFAKFAPDQSKRAGNETLPLVFPQVDMFKISSSMNYQECPYAFHQKKHLAKRQLSLLLCCDGSSNEHQVLKDIFNDPYAISTIKLLQIAHEKHQSNGLSGLGFLDFTPQRLTYAEQFPINAKCLFFNHLKDLNLNQVRLEAGIQWETAKKSLQGLEVGDHFSYAYMTPGPISSKDGNDLIPPSYRGVGTLIMHKKGSFALISNGLNTMNGGYGSRQDTNFVNAIANNEWKIIQNKQSFSLMRSEFSSLFNGVNQDTLLTHIPTKEFHFDDLVRDYTLLRWKVDVRPTSKSLFDTVADPVDVVTGAFYVDEVDLTLPGNFPLDMRRNYNNQNPINGLLGVGWKISLNPHLIEEDDHLFAAELDGTVIDYRLNPTTSSWEVFSEDNLELHNNTQKGIGGIANLYHAYITHEDDQFILHGSDGSIRLFENNHLKSWTDNKGNALTFIYHEEQLVRIENSQDGYLGFYYNHEGRISEAYTKDGRRVYYSYNFYGDLIQVELPNGALVSYEYDHKHQIIKENKSHGKVLENIYDDSGRVKEQLSPNSPQQQMVTTAKFIYGDNINTVEDASGALTEYKIYKNKIYKITDPEGNCILQSYFIDDHTWFDAETEQLLSWNEQGAYPQSLKSSIDKRGLITEYRYDENGNLSQTCVRGRDLTGFGDQEIVKNYSYNEQNLCVSERSLNYTTVTHYEGYLPKRVEKHFQDKLMDFIELKYNMQGQIIEENHSNAFTFYEYDTCGFLVKITKKTGTLDPDVTVSFLYNHQGQCIEQVSTDGIVQNEYDIMGNLLVTRQLNLLKEQISSTYFGYNLNNEIIWQMNGDFNTIQIDYNAMGLPKSKREALSKAVVKNKSVKIEKAGMAYTLFDYDSRGHLIQEVDPKGYCTYREYDRLGRLSKITKENQSSQVAYEKGGLIAEIISPLETKINREYATNGLLIKEIYPDQSESHLAYDLLGRLITETKNGMTLNIEYDDLQNKIIYYNQGSLLKTEEFDTKGNLISLTDALGNTWKKDYDHLGRLTADTDPQGNLTTWQYINENVICTLPTKEVNIQHYQAGKVVESKTMNPQGIVVNHTASQTFANENRIQEIKGDVVTDTWVNFQSKPLVVQQDDLLTTYYYDPCGNCIATSDGEGRTTINTFDPLNRCVKTTRPNGSIVAYEYNSNSHLIACHLPGEISWKADYDSMGRKIHEELQAKGEISQNWNYIYDKHGRLQEALDPNLVLHTYRYDFLGRLIERKAGNEQRNYTYNVANQLLTVEQIGADTTKIERSYDCCGNLELETVFLNSQLMQESKQLWEPGKRTLQIGKHQREFYYEAHQLKKIETTGMSFSYTYNLSGALTQKGTHTHNSSYEYNASGLPQTLTTSIFGKESQETLSWDKSSKISHYNSNAPLRTNKQFSYSSQGQLQSINSNEYQFDFGNSGSGILTESPDWKATMLDPFGKIISEISSEKIISTSYDRAGQIISRNDSNKHEAFKWDSWGNLIEINSNDYTWKAAYDAFGRRLQTIFSPKNDESIITTSCFDPHKEFEEIGVYFQNKIFWKIFGNQSCEAIIDENGKTATLAYDALGHLMSVFSENEVYDIEDSNTPYGPKIPLKIESNVISFAKAHAWQNRRLDPTGYLWMGARYFDSVGGRFLSADPVGIPVSIDLYNYANGDPINFTDPDGRFATAAYAISNPITGIPKAIFNWTYGCFENFKTLGTMDSKVYIVGNYSKPGKKIIFVNGMMNSDEDAIKITDHISELAGGHEVTLVYNPSKYNLVADCFRWYASCKWGFQTEVVKNIQKEFDSFLDISSNAEVLLIGFSEGATSSRNSLLYYDEDLRKQINVLLYCPSAYTDKEICGSIQHYCSESDFVHKIVFEGFTKGQANVTFLSKHPKASWIDHDGCSPTFTGELRENIELYLGK